MSYVGTRSREDARNRATVAEAEEHKKENIRERRIEGGSRFNMRYRDGVPESALTVESVMQALAEYVDFGESAVAQAPSPLISQEVSTPVAPPPGCLERACCWRRQTRFSAPPGPPPSAPKESSRWSPARMRWRGDGSRRSSWRES
jgi:hypothetical protein